MLKKKGRRGFTLIELMIAMAISVSVMGIGIVRFRDFNRIQSVKSVGQTLKNNLRDIQAKALAGVKPEECTIPTSLSLDGYRVDFGTDDYTVQALCDGTPSGPLVTYTLLDDFVITPSVGDIDFLVLGQGASTDLRIRLRAYTPPDAYYYRICVSQGGDIKDCGYTNSALNDDGVCPCP